MLARPTDYMASTHRPSRSEECRSFDDVRDVAKSNGAAMEGGAMHTGDAISWSAISR